MYLKWPAVVSIDSSGNGDLIVKEVVLQRLDLRRYRVVVYKDAVRKQDKKWDIYTF